MKSERIPTESAPADTGALSARNRFDGKSRLYAAARPTYPEACLKRLQTLLPTQNAHVVDVGAGTGLLTAQLLSLGCRVTAVEPNAEMRAEADRQLGAQPGYRAVDGTAEATGLSAHSCDLITAAQAFHWFDAVAFRRECQRILKPGGRVALLWNFRTPDAPVNRACAALCRELCPTFRGFSAGFSPEDERIRTFFAHDLHRESFENNRSYTRDGFVKRMLSASYAPKPGEPSAAPFAAALNTLFDQFADGETLTVANITCLFDGQLL